MKYFILFFLVPFFVYLFLTVLPNFVGCLLPAKFCLEGSGKLNDILTISASLIPSLLVLEAYKIWRKQKSAELMAIRASEIYKFLKDILKCLDILDLKIKDSPGTTTTLSQEYKDFDELYKTVKEELDLFKLLLDEEKSTHCKRFNEFYNSYIAIGDNLGKINLYRIWAGDDNILYRDVAHYQKIRNQVKISSFKVDVENGFKLLAKIILHK